MTPATQLRNKRWILNTNLILRADLLYLMLPCILFLLGWVQAYIAVPLVIALAVCAGILCRRELPLIAEEAYNNRGGAISTTHSAQTT